MSTDIIIIRQPATIMTCIILAGKTPDRQMDEIGRQRHLNQRQPLSADGGGGSGRQSTNEPSHFLTMSLA